MYSVFYIDFQLMTGSQDHWPCLQPLPSLGSPQLRSQGVKVAGGPHGKREEKTLHPPRGHTREGEKGLLKEIQYSGEEAELSPVPLQGPALLQAATALCATSLRGLQPGRHQAQPEGLPGK